MLIVGELINTSRKQVKVATEMQDGVFIKDIAQKQALAGADYIDVNCGTVIDDEPATMRWLVATIQDQVKQPLCIDSPNPRAIEEGLANCRYGQPMINSISGEKERYRNILPLVLKYRAKVVALGMDDISMPETASGRLEMADKVVGSLLDAGVPDDDIYFDPLIKPISTNHQAGKEVLDALLLIKNKYPNIHLICGLSNISFGLPQRKVLNQAFMIQTMTAGMDSYILDPLDKVMMGFLYASQVVLGQDEYCMKYIQAYRQGLYNQ